MIYLDNGATTWPKPPSVLGEMCRCIKYYAANPGRGGHKMALRAGEEVYRCRESVSDFFGLDNPQNVIFTLNATHSLNMAIKGILKKGGHVVTTSMEHNSVLRPLNCSGAEYDTAYADLCGYVNAGDVEKLIKSNTCLIVCTLASNVCGSVQPFEKIAEIARKHSIPFLLDASQGAGAININMKKMGIDMLAAPGHKGLYGPAGTGVLCINTDAEMNTIIEGGTGSRSKELAQPNELPDKLESGTLNIAGIAGLGKGISFVNNMGIDEICYRENKLASILAEDLSVIPGVRLAGYDNTRPRIGVVSAVLDNFDCVSTASILSDEYSIATRAGYHCAYTAHSSIGTGDSGTVRFSLGAFNTVNDVKMAAYAVKRIAEAGK